MKTSTTRCVLLLCLLTAACREEGRTAADSAVPTATFAETAVQSQQPETAPAAPSDGVARVSVADTREGLQNGSIVLIDVRSTEQFQAGHIPGALHFPADRIRTEIKSLPGDKMIVAYCT